MCCAASAAGAAAASAAAAAAAVRGVFVGDVCGLAEVYIFSEV